GDYHYADFLDSDGIEDEPVRISASVVVQGSEMRVSFSGSSPQVRGNCNTVAAVAKSATYYVVRCLIARAGTSSVPTVEIPMNHGTFAPITVIVPKGSVINARPPAGVAQGNVE